MAGEPFVFRDKTAAFDVEELINVLKDISEEEFASYVSNGKNDFANWIEYSLQKKQLADSIRPLFQRDMIVAVLDDAVGLEAGRLIIGDSHVAHTPVVHEMVDRNIELLRKEEEERGRKEAERLSGGASAGAGAADAGGAPAPTGDKKGGSTLVIDFPLKLKRMLVRDFMFGLLCGLVLGAVLLGIYLRLFM